jgi:hypothetical protein
VQNTFYVEILGSVSEKKFSLDELVLKTQELFKSEGMAGFVGFILRILDEKVSLELCGGQLREQWSKCCERTKWELHQLRKRRFRTSIGKIVIQWRSLKCRFCNKSVVPLREILGLKRYQSKTSELERVLTEVIIEQSYRRTSRHLGVIGQIPIPKSTAHRWVMESDCDELKIPEMPLDIVLGDGTAFKGRNLGKSGYYKNQGDLRILMGITVEGELVPIGSWAGRSWEEIGEQIRQQYGANLPVAEVLLSDGELGLAEGLAGLANHQQRCHWHQIRELRGTLWKDKAPLKEKKQMQSKLAAILGLHLPETSHDSLSPEERNDFQKRMLEAEQKIDSMIAYFASKRYVHAAMFMQRAKNKLFTYVRLWLETGLVCPRVSSWIERLMREIARRLKRIAFGWSNQGAAKMTRILIKRITSAKQWNAYWQNRFQISGDVVLLFRGVAVK